MRKIRQIIKKQCIWIDVNEKIFLNRLFRKVFLIIMQKLNSYQFLESIYIKLIYMIMPLKHKTYLYIK